MVEMFNCTFSLFSNQFYPGKKLRECTFRNVSKHNVDHFLEYISNDNGKGILNVLRIEYSIHLMGFRFHTSKLNHYSAFHLLIFISSGSYRREKEKVCARACTKLRVTFGYPWIYDVKNNDSGSISFYFETSIPVRESQLKYDGASLFAEIGGYTGLLLGISFLDFSKMLNYCWERINLVGPSENNG